MQFRIKNISPYTVTALGVSIQATKSVDLLLTLTTAAVKQSLLYGELYDKIQGRMLTITHPPQDVPFLGLTDTEYNFLTHAGFFQSKLGDDNLKDPFRFSADGYLLTDAKINVSIDNVAVDITGIDPNPAERDSILLVGTNDGYYTGTPRVLSVSSAGGLKTSIIRSDGYAVNSFYNSSASSVSYIGKPSNGDFTTAYASSTTITCTVLPFAQLFDYDIVRIIQISNTGVTTVWDRIGNTITCSGTTTCTITVVGATFASTDLFVVETSIAKLNSFDVLTGADKVVPIRDISDSNLVETLISTTNAGAATNYAPSTLGLTMAGYKNISFQIIISGGVTATIEVSNDDTGTNWSDITKSGYDLISNDSGFVNFIDTNCFMCYEGLNCYAVRVKYVTADATNAIFIAARRTF